MKHIVRNICTTFLLAMLLINIASAANMNISLSRSTVKPGQQFTVDIFVIPEGHEKIAGIQSDFLFDDNILKVDNIKEGDLLKHAGNTFFNQGNTTKGKISNIYSAIITPGKNISTSGVFVTIEMKANSEGRSSLKLENIIISDPEGKLVKVNTINRSVTVSSKDISVPVEVPETTTTISVPIEVPETTTTISVPIDTPKDKKKESSGFGIIAVATVMLTIYMVNKKYR